MKSIWLISWDYWRGAKSVHFARRAIRVSDQAWRLTPGHVSTAQLCRGFRFFTRALLDDEVDASLVAVGGYAPRTVCPPISYTSSRGALQHIIWPNLIRITPQCDTPIAKWVGVEVTVVTRTSELLGSNLGRETCHFD
jgi:hypothetical protein